VEQEIKNEVSIAIASIKLAWAGLIYEILMAIKDLRRTKK
jgi:hypothetical protein